MDLYPWIVFVHVSATLLFFIAHGASMAVAFRLKRERDPARVRALLDLSSWTLGIWPSVAFLVGVVAGIAAGIIGGWFGRLWIWTALVLLVIVTITMTPLVAARVNEIRAAAGTRSINPFSRQPPAAPPDADPVALDRLLDAWNPAPAAVIGFGGFVIILWLMFFKPF
ncbi:MAG: hypothetical protein ACRDGV_10915 [Candidatus Limnocylindria bacterium]